jgi:gamma-glutamyltranspeptidase/glutathione hydrolase
VRRPRYHRQYVPDRIVHEHRAVILEEIAALERRGHFLQLVGAPCGDMPAVVWHG